MNRMLVDALFQFHMSFLRVIFFVFVMYSERIHSVFSVLLLFRSTFAPFRYANVLRLRQFLCYQNIKLFVDACKNHFGLKESELFEPTMLYHLTNFHRVLITLSKLSKKVAQIHTDVP